MDVRGIADSMQRRFDEFLEALRELVDIDSGTFTRDGVNRVVDLCEARFRRGGWEGERITLSVGPVSTKRPAYMTAMRSATSAATPTSCVTNTTAIPSSCCS